MGTLIEMLATKKKPAGPVPEGAVHLPMVRKEHEGACDSNCACGADEGSCCG